MVVVLKSVLNAGQLKQLRAQLDPALFQPAQETAFGIARQAKRNLQLGPDHAVGRSCAESVLQALQAHGPFLQAALPVRMTPPMFNLYAEGMSYGHHADAALMDSGSGIPMRSDLSLTVFLSDPSEYDGGELVFSSVEGMTMTAKLEAGQAVLYPSNMLHEVKPVTRGARLASIVWVQSAIADEPRRNILLELDHVRQALERGDMAQTRERLVLVRENLIRLFAQP